MKSYLETLDRPVLNISPAEPLLTAGNTDQSESDSGEVDKYEDDEDSYDASDDKEL